MPRWKVNPSEDNISGLEADFVPMCGVCEKQPMEVLSLKLLNFPLNEPDWWKKGEQNAYAIDVEVWCPACGLWDVFGVACPKDHWKKLHSETKRIYETSTSSQVEKKPGYIPRA